MGMAAGKARGTGQPGAALAIFPGALGDFICAAPALCALVERHGSLDLAVGRFLRWLAGALIGAGLAPTLEDRRWADLFASGEGGGGGEWLGTRPAIYSWLGAANPHFRSALAAWSEVPARFYRLPQGRGRVHASREYLEQVGEGKARLEPRLLAGLDGEAARSRLGTSPRQRRQRGPHLLVHPGSGSTAKRWDPAAFLEILRWWQVEIGGAATVLLGPAEREEWERWALAGFSLVRDVSVKEAARSIFAADLFLGNDSGIGHLAGAVGAKGAVVFGPTDPYRWAPLGGDLVAIAPTTYSRPAGRCRRGGRDCLPKVRLVAASGEAKLVTAAALSPGWARSESMRRGEAETPDWISQRQIPVSEVKKIIAEIAQAARRGKAAFAAGRLDNLVAGG